MLLYSSDISSNSVTLDADSLQEISLFGLDIASEGSEMMGRGSESIYFWSTYDGSSDSRTFARGRDIRLALYRGYRGDSNIRDISVRGFQGYQGDVVSAGSYLVATSANGDTAPAEINSDAFYALSDIRKKENLSPLPDVLEIIRKMPIFFYQLTEEGGEELLGSSAQYFEDTFPELTYKSPTGLVLDYSKLSVCLIKALQELVNKS